MSELAPALRGLRAAFAFLTRVPTGSAIEPDAWAWASAYFSWVGVVLGVVAGVVHDVTAGAGPWVSATLAVGATMLVTGALHEDGLADTADALGGSYERPKLFEILKDPRVGSFGVASLVVVTLLRVAALAELGPHAAVAMVFAHAASRFACTAMMASMPYVSATATSKSHELMATNGAHVGIAAVAPALLVVVLPSGHGASHVDLRALIYASAAALLTALVLASRFHARAGGITGDFLGATQQLTEAAIYVVLAASLA